jgi:rfaE bifunctional protein nucleotidyltransferase chain/domain
VLTNGTFDLLHVGHVRYLETARSFGDVLFVAVNSDASVRAYKGPGRPLNHEGDRVQVVAALEAVDLVTMFDDLTADHVVRAVRPDVYVKGGDYSSDPDSARFPPEGRTVLECGGQVRIVEYVPDRSTTQLIERMAHVMSHENLGER